MLLHELSKQFHDDISGQVCIYVSIANNMTTGSNIRNMGQKQNSHGKTICALSKLRADQAHMQMIVKYTIPRQ
jgi:hypothetical protein